MKEFAEKLIEKLNEISELVRPIGWSRKIEIVETKAVIQIINELQEEYKANLSEGLTSSNNGWIPCSDRLPNELGRYIVTLKDGRSLEAIYDNISKRFIMYEHEVVAWMTMPQPYKTTN